MFIFNFVLPRLLAPTNEGHFKPVLSGIRFGGSLHILPHGSFTYSRRRVPLSGSKGRAVALAQAKYETRYKDPTFIVDINEKTSGPKEASIWSWDKETVRALTGSPSTRVIPEPLARKPMKNGARIVRALQGFDGEIWLDDECIASRWWASEPDTQEWERFLAGARSSTWPVDENGYPLSVERPETSDPVWDKGLFWVTPDWRSRLSSLSPLQVAAACLLVAAAPVSCQGAGYLNLQSKINALDTELIELRAASEPWLQLRRRALADAQYAANLSELGDPASIVFALMDLSDVLAEDQASLERVEYIDGELRTTVRGGIGQNVVSLVSALEQSASWNGVRYDPNSRQIIGQVQTQSDLSTSETAGVAP